MQTQEFAESVDQLIGLAQNGQVAIMCAEVLPWRCHRWLIADAVTIRGIQLEHIRAIKQRTKRSLTSWAHIEGTHVKYPPGLA